MASESSDDDGRSFGSEPDFAAMADLRLETLIDDDPGPSGAHVFDEINDDSPRDFGHDLEITDGARLRLALETFEDAVYGDGLATMMRTILTFKIFLRFTSVLHYT